MRARVRRGASRIPWDDTRDGTQAHVEPREDDRDTPVDRSTIEIVFLMCTFTFLVLVIVVLHFALPRDTPQLVKAILASAAYWVWLTYPHPWRAAESVLARLGVLGRPRVARARA